MSDRSVLFMTVVVAALVLWLLVQAVAGCRRWAREGEVSLAAAVVSWWLARFQLLYRDPWLAAVPLSLPAVADLMLWRPWPTEGPTPRVAVLLTLVVLTAVAAVACAIRDRLQAHREDAPSGEPELARVTSAWLTAASLLWRNGWLLCIPVGLAAVDRCGQWALLRPRSYNLFVTHVGGFSWLRELRNAYAAYQLTEIAKEGLRAGALVSAGVFGAALVLVVGLAILARRRAPAAAWLGWAALSVGIGLQIALAVRVAHFAKGHPGLGEPWLLLADFFTQAGIAALIGGLVLLLLRGAVTAAESREARPLTFRLLRFWPAWFLIVLLGMAPLDLVWFASALPSASSSLAWTLGHSPWVRAASGFLVVLLFLALRFAPYALVEGAPSAREAARASLSLWRTRTGEAVLLLVPLWFAGFVWGLLIQVLEVGSSRQAPALAQGLAPWLHTGLRQAFLLFAETVCLVWCRQVGGWQERSPDEESGVLEHTGSTQIDEDPSAQCLSGCT